MIPLAFDRDIAGPMTRTVEDAARIFNVVAGYDPADPYTEAGRNRKEADYTTFLDTNGLQGARVGVLRELVNTDDADTAVTAVFEQAVQDLRRLGAVIVDPFEFPSFREHRRARNGCQRFRYDMHQYLSTRNNSPIQDVMEVLERGQFSPYVERRIRRNERGSTDVAPEDRDPPAAADGSYPARTRRPV